MKKDKIIDQTETTESLEPVYPVEPEIAGVPEPELREPQSYFYEPQELVAQPFLPEPKEDNDFEIPLMPQEQPPEDIKESKGSKGSSKSNKSNSEDPGLVVPQAPQSSKIVLISTPTNTTTLFEVMARKQRKELNSIEL